jgi:hypothetical protein
MFPQSIMLKDNDPQKQNMLLMYIDKFSNSVKFLNFDAQYCSWGYFLDFEINIFKQTNRKTKT